MLKISLRLSIKNAYTEYNLLYCGAEEEEEWLVFVKI
jgi:hypothetical protein